MCNRLALLAVAALVCAAVTEVQGIYIDAERGCIKGHQIGECVKIEGKSDRRRDGGMRECVSRCRGVPNCVGVNYVYEYAPEPYRHQCCFQNSSRQEAHKFERPCDWGGELGGTHGQLAEWTYNWSPRIVF